MSPLQIGDLQLATIRISTIFFIVEVILTKENIVEIDIIAAYCKFPIVLMIYSIVKKLRSQQVILQIINALELSVIFEAEKTNKKHYKTQQIWIWQRKTSLVVLALNYSRQTERAAQWRIHCSKGSLYIKVRDFRFNYGSIAVGTATSPTEKRVHSSAAARLTKD